MRRFLRILSLMLTLLMFTGLCARAEGTSIIDLYNKPDAQAKGMFRYWIPYAVESREELEAQMTDMYESGFGGVEIAFLPFGVNFDNTVYGWGTENWRQMMKYILEIAASFEDGFLVDFTISPGWPVALNSIDPNDDEADMKLITAQVKLPQAEGVIDVPMQPVATTDLVRNSFILTDRLVAAVAGKVTSVGPDGTAVLDPDSLTVLETALSDRTTPAGIPALDRLEEGSEAYEYVKALYGETEPATEKLFTDSLGREAAAPEVLNDVQNYWTVDLSQLELGKYAPSEGDGLAAGDWVLYGFYERGTGDSTMKMGFYGIMTAQMPGVSYYTNPISLVSTQELIRFLDENIFCDEELVALMNQAGATIGGNIFEDSIENGYKGGIPWAVEYADKFEAEKGYSMLKYLPIITTSAQAADGSDALLHEDYNDVYKAMYSEYHIAPLQQYFREKLNFGFRAQGYITSTDFVELDLSDTSAQVDVAEGESLAFGINFDSFRLVSGGVHIAGKTLVSDEAFAIQEGISYNMPWIRTVYTMNENFAAGVNRLIFHGASFNGIDGVTKDIAWFCGWPGWHAFDMICTDSWDARMPSWDDIGILSNYIARTQAVLQNGTPRMDVLVYDPAAYDHGTRGRIGDNSAFTGLLDAGYSYDSVMEDGVLLPQLVAADGILEAEGPAYQAVVVNNAGTLSEAVVAQLTAFADAGVPVIFYGCVPAGTNSLTEDNAAALSAIDALLAKDNVKVAMTQQGAVDALKALGVTPRASYEQENLRTLLREDADGSRYYFVYNNSFEPIAASVEFEGAGNSYVLNAWTGEIAPMAECEAVEGGLRTTLNLDDHGARIVVLTEDAEAFPAALENPIVETSGEAVIVDGAAAVKALQSGAVTATYADGSTVEAEVTVPESIDLTDWSLTVESWGPDKDTEALTDIAKVTIDLGNDGLGVWADKEAPADQLAAAGVESMANVIGVGTYETQIELEAIDGAYLILEHGGDMITGITVNGTAVADLAPSSDRYDLGSLLVEGTNTIQVELSTTMINRIMVEDGLFANFTPGVYGLMGATIVPYAIVK